MISLWDFLQNFVYNDKILFINTSIKSDILTRTYRIRNTANYSPELAIILTNYGESLQFVSYSNLKIIEAFSIDQIISLNSIEINDNVSKLSWKNVF